MAALVTLRTRAIVAVDYAGLPCDLDALLAIADEHGLIPIEDAAHAQAHATGTVRSARLLT